MAGSTHRLRGRFDFDSIESRIAAIRSFNRLYTQKIGVLQDHLLQSEFSLAQVRILYELAHNHDAGDGATVPQTASQLADWLNLDEGYLSRLLSDFEKRRLVKSKPSSTDGRQRLLSLTAGGRRAFAPLDRRSHDEIAALLAPLAERDQVDLTHAVATIARLLAAPTQTPPPIVLREPRPGDLGWIVHRHGVLYAREYSYDEQFEALVAGIIAKFVQNFDAQRERCWVADRGGEIVGSVFVVRQTQRTAKLRLLLVEPSARGLGLGKRLVDECIAFARRVGYRKLVLWTQSELGAARNLYVSAGFRCVHAEPHRSFSQNLVAETWELVL